MKLVIVAMCLLFLSGSVDDDGRVVMSWTANTEPNLATYRVYRMEHVGTVVAPMYVDLNTHHGRDYWYAVTAVDDSGHESGLSPMSDVVQIRVDSLPPRLSITETTAGVTITVAPESVQ